MDTTKPRKRNGRPPKAIIQETLLPDDGAPQHLQDMRHVYMNDEKYDRTQSQKTTRQYFMRNPSGFMGQMFQMERDFRVESWKIEPEAAVVVDDGTDLCLRLAEKLIRELTSRESMQ